jgi:hypothetical protein
MAKQLQLRRGTDADRQTFTPAEGELIYVTDTGKLFVGDNITVGGNAIALSSEFTDFLGNPPADLNTLEKIATALGNDADFANTVTTSITGKANTADVFTQAEITTLLSGKADTSALQGFAPLVNPTFIGTVTSNSFSGDGSGLTNVSLETTKAQFVPLGEGSSAAGSIFDSSASVGSYVEIDNLVFYDLTVDLEWQGDDPAAGAVRVTGLPVAPNIQGYFGNVIVTAGFLDATDIFVARIPSGQNYVELLVKDGVNLTNAVFGTHINPTELAVSMSGWFTKTRT